MGYRLPVQGARNAYEFITENQEAIRAELAEVAVSGIENEGEVGYHAQRLGEVLRTLSGIEQAFRINGWDS